LKTAAKFFKAAKPFQLYLSSPLTIFLQQLYFSPKTPLLWAFLTVWVALFEAAPMLWVLTFGLGVWASVP
jgi:hypothetical protein